MSEITLRTAVLQVSRVWDRQVAQGQISRQSADQFTTLAERFIRFAHATGVHRLDDVDEALLMAFIDAPGRDRRGRLQTEGPAEATRRGRRWVLALLFAEARRQGLTALCPLLDTPKIPRTAPQPRSALTDQDIALIKFHAERGMPDTRHAAIVALLLSGLGTGEIGDNSTADVDRIHRRIWAGGTITLAPRYCPLDEWAFDVIELRSGYLRSQAQGARPQRLVTQGIGTRYSTQASVCTSFADVSRRCGPLSTGRRARPRDVTAYTASRILARTGQITDVAMQLGLASLDVAARLAGLQWDGNRGQR